jgi:flagellar hook-associated protein 1 FlgK
MGLSAAFEIGKQGLRNYQIATEVVSENIANVNTPGYSRQRVILETAPPTTHNGFPLGSGVKISTVERYYDALLQKQLVNAGTTLGFDEKKLQVLQQIEPVFNEVAQDALGAALSNYFNAWSDLALNPTGAAERQAVLDRGRILADQFNYVSSALNDAMVTQNDSVSVVTGDLNRILDNIAQLNGQIKVTQQIYGNANEMLDQRDYLVRQLSEKIAVTYVENSDGTTDVSYTDGTGTYALVTGSMAGSFSTTAVGTLPDGTARNMVQVTTAGGAGPTTVAPVTGELGAVMVTRDTTLSAYLNQVNMLAQTVADTVNTQHQNGFDLNGVAGTAFFTYTAGREAATISVNPALTVATVAASGDATLKGDNANALSIAQLSKTNQATLSNATYSNYFNSLVAQVGLDVQSAANVVKQDEAFMKQLKTLREAHSGVSLDEELTELIKYQRSYQASAKLIATADEMLNVLINMLR